MRQKVLTTPEAARQYIAAGFAPIPIPPGKKAPKLKDWPKFRLTEEEIPSYFKNGGNIGLLLGDPSGGLLDVDIDAPEALKTVAHFLPATDLRSGREGNPGSHWWYHCSEAQTRKHQDPMRPDKDGMLVEIRCPATIRSAPDVN